MVRCVYEARQFAVSSGGDPERGKAAIRNRKEEDKALVVKNWLPGSYGRCASRIFAAPSLAHYLLHAREMWKVDMLGGKVK